MFSRAWLLQVSIAGHRINGVELRRVLASFRCVRPLTLLVEGKLNANVNSQTEWGFGLQNKSNFVQRGTCFTLFWIQSKVVYQLCSPSFPSFSNEGPVIRAHRLLLSSPKR